MWQKHQKSYLEKTSEKKKKKSQKYFTVAVKPTFQKEEW